MQADGWQKPDAITDSPGNCVPSQEINFCNAPLGSIHPGADCLRKSFSFALFIGISDVINELRGTPELSNIGICAAVTGTLVAFLCAAGFTRNAIPIIIMTTLGMM